MSYLYKSKWEEGVRLLSGVLVPLGPPVIDHGGKGTVVRVRSTWKYAVGAAKHVALNNFSMVDAGC